MKYHYLAELLAIVETEITRLTQFSKHDGIEAEILKFVKSNLKDKKELKKVLTQAMKEY